MQNQPYLDVVMVYTGAELTLVTCVSCSIAGQFAIYVETNYDYPAI